MTHLTSPRVLNPADLVSYSGPELYLFIGIDTAGSSVHTAFPLWSPLFREGSVVRGIDLSEDAPAQEFRDVVTAMRDNPRIMGAVVTSHKLRLYKAVSHLLDYTDPLVSITHEINALDTRDGRIAAFARDAQSLDIVLDTTGSNHQSRERSVLCIGAGGSAIALMLAMCLDVPATISNDHARTAAPHRRRGPLTILGRRESSLKEIDQVRQRAGVDAAGVRLELAQGVDAVSTITRSAAPATLIANATGLGKFTPGSPVSGFESFPPGTTAWDFNYRGPLTFLEQAKEAGVDSEDGWDYFLAGWAAALAAISGIDLDQQFFGTFQDISVPLRS